MAAEEVAVTVRLFHLTTADAARAILTSGFRDARGSYGTELVVEGVWLTDAPEWVSGAKGDEVLQVELDVAIGELADFEWVEEGKSYREWCIPAEFIAAHGRVTAAEAS